MFCRLSIVAFFDKIITGQIPTNKQERWNFYEKAFELGLNSEKSRDIYINSIINSPLNIESQEKLVNFINIINIY